MSRPDFAELEATELFCPTCQRAQPVVARLLLVLPQGDKYDYVCRGCGASVGEKLATTAPRPGALRSS